jgi:formylglycine-generating enzyme required for sulfatase activity
MSSPQPLTLEEKIDRLAPEVDTAFREELHRLLRTLHDARDPIGVLLSMSRVSLLLLRAVFERAGHPPPSENLYDCIVRAARGDGTQKIQGLRLLPDEIASYLHTLRTLSNKPDHAAEQIHLLGADADNALNTFLRVLQWFYCEYDHGPHLSSIYSRTTEPTVEAYAHYFQDCVDRWSEARYALDTHFVHLTLLRDQGEETQGPRWQSGPEQFHDLGEVLAKVEEPALVLLGSPGAGKSTLLRHFQLDSARTVLGAGGEFSQAALTFFIQLNDYQPARPGEPLPLPLDWLAARWAARVSDLPPLETVLRQQRLTLLLDALNEIPVAGSEPVHLWRTFVRELVHDYPGNRVVFSCRSLDYSATLSSRELRVPQVRIEPLSDPQVQEFLTHYCPEHGAILWQKLQGTPQLALFRSPYYLILLIEQSTTSDIPVGRAALFTGFVRRALQRELEAEHPLLQADALLHVDDVTRLTQGLWSTSYELPESGPLLPRLSSLAWQMQGRGLGDEAGQVRIRYDEAVTLLDHPRAEDILRAGVALLVLERDLRRDRVLYRHQLLQEYFAARYLAQAPQPELVHQEWRAKRVVPSLQSTLQEIADADPLPPLLSTGWEETMVLAAAMAGDPERFVKALMAHNLALAGRCAAQPDVTISAALREQLRQALVQHTQDRVADLRARIAAGLTLGELGDSRFEWQQGPHGAYLMPPLVEIPSGTYIIGSDEGLFANEAPMYPVTLAPFALGQFPVTNAEWARFMQAGGYDEERWWDTTEAQAWRRGEGTAEALKQEWRDFRKQLQDNFDTIRQMHREGRITSKQADDWEAIARMSDDDFKALLSASCPEGRQTQPMFWTDEAFNNPAQPVVGICWYEAQAYCAWLRAQTGQPFRLPTEAEWEAAARGLPRRRFAFWKGPQPRRYAFGEKFDAARCNTFETHIRRTTPVGVFPGGTTPEGLVDMTGNVWEWTSSVYRDYPYDAADGREDHHAPSTRRVVRGGSWRL